MKRSWVYTAAAMLLALFIIYFSSEAWLSYTAAIYLVMKGKLKSFLLASKKRLWLYFKTMTLFKALTVGIKRFFIDNYLSQWLERHIIAPIRPAVKSWMRYYLSLKFKEKLKRAIYVVLPAGVLIYVVQSANLLESLIFFAEIKALIIGFFKALWFLSAKAWSAVYTLFFHSWIAPLLQIFALSYLLEKIEKLPYIGPPIRSFFERIGRLFDLVFERAAILWGRYVERHISARTRHAFLRIARWLEDRLERLKHRNEIYLMDRFIRMQVREGKAKEYVEEKLTQWLKKNNKKSVATPGEKQAFFAHFNRVSADNINVAAFFDLSHYPSIEDVLVIESFASDRKHGNRRMGLLAGGYWILNLGEEDVTVKTRRGVRKIRSGGIRLFREAEGPPILLTPGRAPVEPIEVYDSS